MELKRYRITGPGSLSRWEHKGKPTPFGQAPHPDAVLVYHAADENAELLLTDKGAEQNAHMKLVPILGRDTIAVKNETDAKVEAAAQASAPAAAVESNKPVQNAAAQAKAKAAAPASISSKL